jgi:hypothetical protein
VIPSLLEIYIVAHPEDDPEPRTGIAETFLRHFHGNSFTGLLDGAIEVYRRSEGWRDAADAPRPIPLPGSAPAEGTAPAAFAAIVPVIGNGLAAAVEGGGGPWHDYLRCLAATATGSSNIACFPLEIDPGAAGGTVVGRMFSRFQQIGRPDPLAEVEPVEELRCRDLAQGLAQFLRRNAEPARLTVFISHTKHAEGSKEKLAELIAALRRTIATTTRLGEFFDSRDLQVGEDWAADLAEKAGGGALLALRTDLYATREWCQREMLIAKRAGAAIVTIDALQSGEARGSFLLDHTPRLPIRRDSDGGWCLADIRHALNLLVDECLKRTLWRREEELVRQTGGWDIDWWAPHAPEAVTLVEYLAQPLSATREASSPLRVIHPDPPLGPEERSVLDSIAKLAGHSGGIEMLTPRTLAARSA